MFSFVPCVLVLTFCLKLELILGLTMRKFVYQKDVSEHCRRRVMPSVFLGRHVVDANSQILHFTKLELPYSCFISVRSESGSNIILVLQMVFEDDITSSCSKNGNQLLVYEMSETFGGYWGPLADSMVKRDRVNDTKFYTLKTTQPPEPSILDSDESEDTVKITTENVDSNITTISDDSGEYIRIDLPIVNVSGKLVPGEAPPKNIYDTDDSFDFLYDVTPRPGFSYDTSITPLVQFSMMETFDIQRMDNGDSADTMGYNLEPVTPDGRNVSETRIMLLLSSTLIRRKQYKKQKYNVNSRLKFNTKKSPTATYRRYSYIKKPVINTQQHILTNPFSISKINENTTENTSSMDEKTNRNISWEFIEGPMKSYDQTSTTTHNTVTRTSQDLKNISNIFQKILDTRHNSSVYLSPNLSVYYKDVPLHASVLRMTTSTREKPLRVIKGTETNLFIKSTMSFTRTTENVLMSDLKLTHSVHYGSTTQFASSMINVSHDDEGITSKKTYIKTAPTSIVENFTSFPGRYENLSGSLVDRESWDNVVQVAPAMAVILHQLRDNQSTHHLNISNNPNRKKRYIESVPVENARPHNITTKADTVTTTTVQYDVADMQDLAQLVEIQDDELHGRVALRYLRRYVGPALLNICDYTDTSTKQVYLFNSSRIVLAIRNFTMDHMKVIVTPARTVMTADGRCPVDHLECQVSGARVCVDSLTACDGIPNCGAYDIYDEDRLMCGAAIGLQHNVYLAAFTFLAVLLTLLYGVHYWLKRCVPKVSDAFFLYTDGSENVLYVDTIMRSPADDEDASKIIDQGNILDEDFLLFSEVNAGKKRNMFMKFFIHLCTCSLFRENTKKQDAYNEMTQEGLYASLEEEKKRFSYAELELRKILNAEKVQKDMAVQTGDSLEMSNLTNVIENKTKKRYDAPYRPKVTDSLRVLNEDFPFQESPFQHSPNELSILNFINNSKSTSSQSKSSDEAVKIKALARNSIMFEEKEITSHTYDHKAKTKNIPTSSKLAASNVFAEGSSDQMKKHLRFEERTTNIPSGDYDDDSDGDGLSETLNRRRSVVLGVSKSWRKRDLHSIEEGEESVGSMQGNIRFWGKSKKAKKQK